MLGAAFLLRDFLAAGDPSRFGKAKQLLEIDGELKLLTDDQGAKRVTKLHPKSVATVKLPAAK